MFTNEFDDLFNILEECKFVTQRPDHHPEINVLEHSLQTFTHACRESNDLIMRLAGLFHDLGKIVATLDHENHTIDILEKSVLYKTNLIDTEKLNWLIGQHIRIMYFLDGSLKKHKKTMYLWEHKYFKELIILRRWDYMGRNPDVKTKFNRDKILTKINQSL